MEAVSKRKQAVLDVLDEEIAELEEKLQKVQPLIDELSQLKRTRATLLSEKSVTGNIRAGTRITMEQVILAMQNRDGVASAAEIADDLGVDQTIVRSHFNRHRDERYRSIARGEWELIGRNGDSEDEDEEDDDDSE